MTDNDIIEEAIRLVREDGNVTGTEHCLLSYIKARVTHVISADGMEHDLYGKRRVRAACLWWYIRPVRKDLLAIYRRVNEVKK